MITIRPEQMKVFEDDALRRFKEEMVKYSKEFSPQLCEVLGDEQLRIALTQAMQRADEYGFTNRGSIRLYIEMMFLFGSDFDTDPQYSRLGEILNKEDEQMQRAEALHNLVIDYHEQVGGPDASYVYHALQALPGFASSPLVLAPETIDAEMLRKMKQIYPQKEHYVGNEGLTRLIHEGRTEAKTYGFPTIRGDVLLVILKFAFGHGCTNDPLYPWISQTLKDKRIVNPAARARRLEKKALTWLDHVLSKPREGVVV